MENDKIFKVINRSGSKVVYRIPELNLRREFAPGEYKNIPYSELEKLSFQPGGTELIYHYLLIQDEQVLEELQVPTEPEYFWTDAEVIEVLTKSSLDRFKDALEFAPDGTKQLIKDWAVKLPLNDVAKRMAMKEMWRFDVDAAVRNDMADKADDNAPARSSARRAETESVQAPQRRTSKYSVKE